MTADEIKAGHCYEAKKPAFANGSYFNDRQVKWISQDRSVVQYDGPAVANGRHFPTTSMEKFLKWVGRDVTAIMPPGEWRDWIPPHLRGKP